MSIELQEFPESWPHSSELKKRSMGAKPQDCQCTTPWTVGTVPAITEDGVVEVDGIHQHVADIHLLTDDVSGQLEESGASSDSDKDKSVLRQELHRSQRVHGQPWQYDAMDFACAACDLAIKGRCNYGVVLVSGMCPLPLSSVEAGAGDCSVLGQCIETRTCAHEWVCYVHDDDII